MCQASDHVTVYGLSLIHILTFSTAKRSYSIISIILIILLMGLTIKNRSTLIRYAKIIALMAVLAVVLDVYKRQGQGMCSV